MPLPEKTQGVACSVVVATWRRPGPLRRLLDSLAQEQDCEVIVVCDGEDGETRALARSYSAPYPLRWIFSAQNRGLAATRNAGAAAAIGTVILFLDDDVVAEPGIIARHLAAHAAAGERFIVLGRVQEVRELPCDTPTDRLADAVWRQMLDKGRETSASPEAGPRVERAVHCGVNCSISRTLFQSLGGFDERLRETAEEMELGQRLYRAGVRSMYEPHSVVQHHNTKAPTDYFQSNWYGGGRTDARRFANGERSRQLEYLASHCATGAPASAWLEHNRTAEEIGELLHAAVDLTGSELLFQAWWRIAQRAAYWRGVRDESSAIGRLPSAGTPTCVLAFHSIAAPQSREEASYYISPARFRRRLQWLRAAGYAFSSLADWLGGVPDGRPLLTFDDAYDDLYSELLPAMEQLRLRPLIFVVAGQVGGTNAFDARDGLRPRRLLSAAQLREMQAHGADIGSHSLSHPWLPALTDDELRRELTDSKHRLEDLLGREVATFAYPYGGVDQRVRAAVIAAGYKLAFTVQPGLNLCSDPFYLSRCEVDDRTRLPDFIWQLRTGQTLLQWAAAKMHRTTESAPTESTRRAAKRVYEAARQVRRWTSAPATLAQREGGRQ